MIVSQQAPDPLLRQTDGVMWGSVIVLVVVAALVVIAIWVLVRYVRRTRSIAEEALRKVGGREAESGRG